MRYLGVGLLIYAIVAVSGLIFTAIFLAAVYIKKVIYKMDEEKWDVYFKSMTNSSYILRFWILYLLSISVCSIVGYFIFIYFGFENAVTLSFITFILVIVKVVFNFNKDKDKLLEKINRIRSK